LVGSAFLIIALAMPVQDAAAQDPVGGAIVGGATGAIIGGVLGGSRGAAIGAIIGGATGAAIGAEGEPLPGGYRYYQDACYQPQPNGAWLAVAPEYCAPAPAYAQDSFGTAVDVAPPPLPVYDQPPIPAPGYMWTPGYSAWDSFWQTKSHIDQGQDPGATPPHLASRCCWTFTAGTTAPYTLPLPTIRRPRMPNTADPTKEIEAQRPWCAYPATARYSGQGDRRAATSRSTYRTNGAATIPGGGWRG
jgi:hypothetical protein